MTPTQKLFGKCDDFLKHTLNHATQAIKPIQVRLDHGRLTLRQVGVLEYLPDRPYSEALVLSAGIHGNETAPIELLNLLVDELLNGQLDVTRPTLIIFGHPAAMMQQSRFIAHNMNRLFCGVHRGDGITDTLDAQRANILEAELKRFHQHSPIREHYDFHTAIRGSVYSRFAVCPFQNIDLTQTAQHTFLAACGVEAILLQDRPAATLSAFSAAAFSDSDSNTFSYTVELGQALPFGKNNLSSYQNTLQALHRLLGDQRPLRADLQAAYQTTCLPIYQTKASELRFFTVTHEIIHSGQGFSLNISESVENFSVFPKGTEIWRDRQACYQVQHPVEYIAFPNSQVKPGERAGLMLIETNVPEN